MGIGVGVLLVFLCNAFAQEELFPSLLGDLELTPQETIENITPPEEPLVQPIEPPLPALEDTPALIAPVVSPPPPAPKPASKSAASYQNYENYLDSIVALARAIQPGKDKFEAEKAAIIARTPGPKSEFEKQADYDRKIANFDKDKQKEIQNLEKKFQTEEKARLNRLRAAINYKDIQPEWAGILKRDTTIEGYESRMARLAGRSHDMKRKTEQVSEIVAGMGLSKSDLETLDRKNRIYLARLDRARELMQDYILQERAQVLGTERKKVNMSLGTYDIEKQEHELNMNDITSPTVPFDYVGKVKIPPQQAQEIDRKTDDFTVSIDYINFPFILDGKKLFPGAKKANVYYKDREFPNTGTFRKLSIFETAPGYAEWAMHADSLISGKLVPRKLDSLYAMKRELPKTAKAGKQKAPKEAAGGTWWDRNKNIVRGTFFVLAAAGTGVGIWQNSEAVSKKKDLEILFDAAEAAVIAGERQNYSAKGKEYTEAYNNLRNTETLRNGLYIGAGVFGSVGVVTLFF